MVYSRILFLGVLTVVLGNFCSGSAHAEAEQKPFLYTEESVGKVFDELWQAMDCHYSYFILKKDVDWKALGEHYRPRAIKATNRKELVEMLREMLSHLKDLHIWIQTPEGQVGTVQSTYERGLNPKVILALLEDVTKCGTFAAVGKVKGEGFGYFWMMRQSQADDAAVQQALDAMEKLRDVPGFVVDLRAANGGDERKAQRLAQWFCPRRMVYAKSRFRTGAPQHDAFGPDRQRWLEATERPYTRPVVCLIGSGAVSSGEGFVKMMKCLPHVTLVGKRTRGASGNPRPVQLGETGIAVWFSRWVDLLPDGTPIEGVGIAPAIEVAAPAADYQQKDPTLEKGLEVLRQKVAAKSGG